jgi:hypothetical protein
VNRGGRPWGSTAGSTGRSTSASRGCSSAFWEVWFDVERYPVPTQVYPSGAFDNEAGAFERTLERLLDVVELSIDPAAEAG